MDGSTPGRSVTDASAPRRQVDDDVVDLRRRHRLDPRLARQRPPGLPGEDVGLGRFEQGDRRKRGAGQARVGPRQSDREGDFVARQGIERMDRRRGRGLQRSQQRENGKNDRHDTPPGAGVANAPIVAAAAGAASGRPGAGAPDTGARPPTAGRMPGPLVRWFYTHLLRDRFPSTRGQRRRDSPRLSRARRRGKLAARPRLRDLHGRRRPLRRAPRDLGPLVHGAGAGGPRQLAGHHPPAVAARHLGAGRRRRAAERRPGAAVLAVGRRGGLQRDRAPRHRAVRVEPVRAGARHRAGPRTGVRGRARSSCCGRCISSRSPATSRSSSSACCR